MTAVRCIVIGAGAVGLAVAREIAIAGREVIVLEKHRTFGTETSSRNSEVIHAGLHHPAHWLKTRTCVRGRERLYDYCTQRGIPFARCGKLIVATSDRQIGQLRRIADQGKTNGVLDLELLGRDEVPALEPELSVRAALLSPSTGVVDSHAFMLAMVADAEKHGAVLVYGTEVTGLVAGQDSILVHCGESPEDILEADWVINAAGLGAPEVAARTQGLSVGAVPKAFMAKGTYFALAGRCPFSRLIYPLPVPGGLGIHLTLDLAGQARFGPDVEWVDRLDFDIDHRRASAFKASIRTYWPAIETREIHPSYAGIRPKLAGPEDPATDFRIDGPEVHGVRGLVNLLGIESPGLTAALAIAEHVAGLVDT